MSNYGKIYVREVGASTPFTGGITAQLTSDHDEEVFEFEYVNLGDYSLDLYEYWPLSSGGSLFYYINTGPVSIEGVGTFEINFPSLPMTIPAGGVSDTFTITVRSTLTDASDSDNIFLPATAEVVNISIPFVKFNQIGFVWDNGYRDSDSYFDEDTAELIEVNLGEEYTGVLSFYHYEAENLKLDGSGSDFSTDEYTMAIYHLDDRPIGFSPFSGFTNEDDKIIYPTETAIKYKITFHKPVKDFRILFVMFYNLGFGLFANYFSTVKRFTVVSGETYIDNHVGNWVVPQELVERSHYRNTTRRHYAMHEPTLDFYEVDSYLDWGYIDIVRWHGEVTFNYEVSSIDIDLGLGAAYYLRDRALPDNVNDEYFPKQGPWMLHRDPVSFSTQGYEYALCILNQTTDEWTICRISPYASKTYSVIAPGTPTLGSIPRSYWTDDTFVEGEKLVYQVVRFRSEASPGTFGTVVWPGTSSGTFRNNFIDPPTVSDGYSKLKYTSVAVRVSDQIEVADHNITMRAAKLESPYDYFEHRIRRELETYTAGFVVTSVGDAPVVAFEPYTFDQYGTRWFTPAELHIPVNDSEVFTFNWLISDLPDYEFADDIAFNTVYQGDRTQFPEIPYTRVGYITGLTPYYDPLTSTLYDDSTGSWANYGLEGNSTGTANLVWVLPLGQLHFFYLIRITGWKIGAI